MTFQKILNDVSMDIMTLEDASKEIQKKDHLKKINYYAHLRSITQEPLSDGELQELECIVDILQILYNSAVGSPISDSDFDSMQETLVDMGIPRLTGTVEINDSAKVSGTYTTLRGTLDKTYYLYPNEPRTNKSRKYLDEWIKSTEALYEKKTGKKIDLNKVKICIQPKLDGCVPPTCKITTSNGIEMPISALATKFDNGEDIFVMSYNEKLGILEPKRVSRVYKYVNDGDDRWHRIQLGAINRRFHWSRPSSPLSVLYSTDNHPMPVFKDGSIILKPASEIVPGDMLMVPRQVLSNAQEQIIRGSILGDGSLSPSQVDPNKEYLDNRAMSMSHSLKQYDYIKWKARKLGYLMSGRQVQKVPVSKGSYSKNEYKYILLTHRSQEIAKVAAELKDDEIEIPMEFLNKMNSLGLAIWYMDDGVLSIANPTPRVSLSTEAFGYKQQEVFKAFLDSRGYFCRIENELKKATGRLYYRLCMTPEGSKNFWTDVSHFIIPSMQYKLPEHFRGRFVDIPDEVDVNMEVDFRKVTENCQCDRAHAYNRYRPDGTSTRYDLEVEDNHNYFANGVLIHNCSASLEWDSKTPVWITRGDTANNRASDVSHVMKQFNDLYCNSGPCGVKFEVMMTEENLQKINELIADPKKRYKNSRQVVTSILNSTEPDFKAEYLYPVPLRIIHPGEDMEEIHPDMYAKFPTQICTFGDRDTIKKFADEHRYVKYMGMRLRTDGAVLTILDPEIRRVLGRENNINNFEVAYKFTEESAITRVKKVEFYVSDFGYITPVLVVNDVILKGNTINHISLSNKERFDELNLSYGDEVKVLYDIIPYATIDGTCRRQAHGRKIEFIRFCPKCGHELNLNAVQVQCKNPTCPSRIIGNILNYCNGVRIQNIGYSTLEQLWNAGLLKNGIRSLYKLKKKVNEITDLEGFGQLKARKIVSEIEAKRRLKDYEFFGALGIEGISTKSFQQIFAHIKLDDFTNMIKAKAFDLLRERLLLANTIGPNKTDDLVAWVKNTENRNELNKLMNELIIKESYSEAAISKNLIKVVFSGCRPTNDMKAMLQNHGYEACDNWHRDARYLVIPNEGFTSNKVSKAMEKHIPIITIGNITRDIPGLQ